MQDEPEFFGIYEENWPTLQVFLAMSTQWRWTGGMEPRRAGLEYVALPVVFNGMGIKKRKRPEIFNDLRFMESAALKVFNEAE